MNEIAAAFAEAFRMLLSLDADLAEIILLSLWISVAATVLATILALPLGAALALFRFPGRKTLIVSVNALMGLPPVVVGLFLYLLLSRSGPLGFLDLLFTPTAMMIAQCLLVIPIVAALTRQVIEDLWREYGEQLRSLDAGPGRAVWTLLWDGRYSLVTAVLAGFGRAMGEVGAVLIVGGNIAHLTRIMTTAITLETSKGSLDLALGLGIVLVTLALAVNAGAYLIKDLAERGHA